MSKPSDPPASERKKWSTHPPQFCRICGAGVGEFRKDGEGTCPKCADLGRSTTASTGEAQ